MARAGPKKTRQYGGVQANRGAGSRACAAHDWARNWHSRRKQRGDHGVGDEVRVPFD
jgi:hypothetical protein